MTNEYKITISVKKALLDRFPHGVYFKHADRSTGGIPDFSFSVLGTTFWIEMKYLRAGERLKDIIDVKQIAVCHQLYLATAGRCLIVVFEENPRQVTVWVPRNLFMNLYPEMAGPQIGGKALGCLPMYLSEGLDALAVTTHTLLEAQGAIRMPGWPYSIAAVLVRDLYHGRK